MPTAGQLVPGVVEAANFSGPGSYVQNWKEGIVEGSSSKNIPWLGAATDALLAHKWQDIQMLSKVLGEARKFLSQQASPFRGEEFSGIYTRWIVLPIDIIRQVAWAADDMETYTEAKNWLRGYTSFQTLSSLRGDVFRRPAWAKYPNSVVRNVLPAAGIGGSRSWASGKGDTNSRHEDGVWKHIVWVDCEGMCSWLWSTLGNKQYSDITGDSWMRDVYRGLKKNMPVTMPRILDQYEENALNYIHDADAWDSHLGDSMKEAISWVSNRLPQVSIDIIRNKDSIGVYWGKTFHDGSTGTLLVKQIPSVGGQMYVYGPAIPKRSNSHKAHCNVSVGAGYVQAHVVNDEFPDQKMIGDDQRAKTAKQHVCPKVNITSMLYWLRAEGGGISVKWDASGGAVDWSTPPRIVTPPEDDGGGDWNDPIEDVVEEAVHFLVRLWRMIFGRLS